jgi:hypothetical protein
LNDVNTRSKRRLLRRWHLRDDRHHDENETDWNGSRLLGLGGNSEWRRLITKVHWIGCVSIG